MECCEWFGVECSNSTGHVIAIDLHAYGIGGNVSSDLLELHHLNYLDLSGIDFGGNTIPEWIGSIKSLEQLYLVNNNFSGIIPPQLGNLTNLLVLNIRHNFLVREIPESFRNLTRLQVLLMNVNNGLGETLENFFRKISCKELEWIDISFNQYTGPIPDLRACSKLRDLLLHHNPLSGTVPASLGQLSTLEYLDISANSLQGTVSHSLLSKLYNLYWLDLSFNSLTLDFSPDWIPPFSLQTIALASCKMGPSFPKWIQTQTGVSYLDISDAGISDQVPNWLWNLSSKVTYFNLSQNQISGTIPDLSSNFFDFIDVSSNKFSGPLPLINHNISLARFSQNMFSGSISFLCGVLSSQLVLLDFSDNELAGELPNCWNNTRNLIFLNLNDNNFYGEIPHALGSLRSLQALQLRGNNLSGQLPPTLKNCINLLLIDIGSNNLTGKIPPWLGAELANLTHLSLRQNRFYGGIPPEICHLTRIQMLDLSGNNISEQIPLCFDNFTSLVDKNGSISKSISFYIDFKRSCYAYVLVQWKGHGLEYRKTLRLLKLIDLSSNRLVGNIPKAFSNLKGLISLNLSTNSLTGMIDPNIGEMEMLETLDLSNNQLSGRIPVGLAQLNFLSVLDLANNNLTGQIPEGTQLRGFNASVYSGNNELCGPPLPLCPNTSITNQGENNEKKDGCFLRLSSLEFYVPLLLGFIVGFWGVVGYLMLKRSWRNDYFELVDVVGDWLITRTPAFLAKFRR
ncbi:hypothetical protein C2S53_019004 [Perilla frutescens var. hirtella]|uniref:Uncharacterized protein n=1 Tax=Perilla frutescens var. hirtella TaxID=608512 RepID=A0AAD4JIZ3_PERFH|nr:hypothetical protein C2S53_019004 [Perilla frutescens var. hirtella]